MLEPLGGGWFGSCYDACYMVLQGSPMTGMLTIRLPAKERRWLQRLSRERGVPMSDLAREAMRRYLALQEFQAIRMKLVPLAEARGIYTDEDVFKIIS